MGGDMKLAAAPGPFSPPAPQSLDSHYSHGTSPARQISRQIRPVQSLPGLGFVSPGLCESG